MYNTTQNYKNKILNDSIQHELNIYIDGNKIEPNHIIDFKPMLELFNNNEFCLGCTPEIDIEFEIDKRDLPETYNEVYVETGLEDEIIPFGKFTIQSIEDDEFRVKIKATDYMKKFEDNKYDGSSLTYPATMLQVLQDICTKIGVELGSTSFLNDDKQISVYDNTVTARTYISYIAEQAEGFAVIGRDGKLYIKVFGEDTVNIDINLFNDFKWGDKFKVSRVSYEDGTQNYKFGNETASTVYINQNNMFIVDSEQIENIYNQIKDFEVYSFEGETIIDPAYDIGDILVIDGKKVLYQGALEYVGKFKANIKSKIQAKTEQESMQTKSKSSEKIRRVQSELNQIDGKITQLIQETTENSEKITEHEQTLEGIKDKVSNIEETTNTIDGSNRIVLEKCLTGKLLELHVFGNNTVFDYLALDDELCLSDELYLKGDSTIIVTDENNNVKEYELGVNEVLRQSETTYDEYVLENGKAKVIRRINADGTVKESETVEELGEMLIELAEGTNVITIKNYSANLRAKFVIQNNLTDIYASKVELKSSIEQTASKINLETNKKLEDYSKTTEMNAAIGLESGRINLETNKKLEEYSKTTEITAAIKLSTDEINQKLEKKVDDTTITGAYLVLKINNDKSSGKLSADKVEISASDILNLLAGNTINLTSKSIKISSDNFNVDASGKVKIIDKTAGSITESKAANFTVVSADGKNVSEIIPNRLKITSANASAYFWLTDDWAYTGVTSANGIAKCRMISAGSDLTFIDCTDGTNASEMTPTGISTPKLTQTSLLENKKNIEKMQDSALDIIKNIDIYRYNLNSEKDEDKKHLGFVISEKYNYSKEVTSTDDKGVDNYSFTSLCCKAIQELTQKVEQLQEKIKKMEETS